jgi:N-acetylmuramoyl-L-alanine amidase
VEPLAEPALRPAYYITTLGAAPAAGVDLVTIPRLQPVPFSLHPDPAGRILRLRLYGVQSSSTWITHREGLRVMDRLSWEQIAPETYQVNIHLQDTRIWGYTLTAGPTMLELRLKHPPAGTIKLAIEAGHGGSNLGAVGLSGLLEKMVNLDVAQRLEKLCREAGLQVLQVRDADIDMSLGAKKERVEVSDADLLVSIHANAGGTANGYLGANGVSTYYNNPFWGDFARVVYRSLLELPLQEFGCVGSFNYRVIRMSSRPAILVELAFLSHAGDEEKLFLPEFRQQLAEKILAGVTKFAASMRE